MEWEITYLEKEEQKSMTVELDYHKTIQVERWFKKRNKGNSDITLVEVSAIRQSVL